MMATMRSHSRFSMTSCFLPASRTCALSLLDTQMEYHQVPAGVKTEEVNRRKTLVLATAGVAIGAAGALVATRWLDQYLVGIAPTNPATFLFVALLMIGAALAAAAMPAWRAARMDPTIVLRAE